MQVYIFSSYDKSVWARVEITSSSGIIIRKKQRFNSTIVLVNMQSNLDILKAFVSQMSIHYS